MITLILSCDFLVLSQELERILQGWLLFWAFASLILSDAKELENTCFHLAPLMSEFVVKISNLQKKGQKRREFPRKFSMDIKYPPAAPSSPVGLTIPPLHYDSKLLETPEEKTLGMYSAFQIPPLSGIKDNIPRVIELQMQEIEILNLLLRLSTNAQLGQALLNIQEQFPKHLFATFRKRSSKQIGYLWDWIRLLEEERRENEVQNVGDLFHDLQPIDGRSIAETAIFLMQVYHLSENLKSLKQNGIKLTPSQLVAFRYLPVQCQTWIGYDRKLTPGTSKWKKSWKVLSDADLPVGARSIDPGWFSPIVRGATEKLFCYAGQCGLQKRHATDVDTVALQEASAILVYPSWSMGDLCLYVGSLVG
jgi:hypothetical protein